MVIPLGLSYDDVLLVPQKTDISSRSLVDTSTYLTKNLKINVPIVSANMDTVTEGEMAVTMALNGGIGIIHRFLTIKGVSSILLKREMVILCKEDFLFLENAENQPT